MKSNDGIILHVEEKPPGVLLRQDQYETIASDVTEDEGYIGLDKEARRHFLFGNRPLHPETYPGGVSQMRHVQVAAVRISNRVGTTLSLKKTGICLANGTQ